MIVYNEIFYHLQQGHCRYIMWDEKVNDKKFIKLERT